MSSAIQSFDHYNGSYFKTPTNNQVSEGLDVFYKDYRNRAILTPDAVWVVLNNIAGTPQSQIDSLTENLRKNASRQ